MTNLPQKIKLITIVVALLFLCSCDIDESITPNDLIAPTGESNSTYQYYFPVIRKDKRVERYAWFTARGYPANPCINLLADGETIVGETYSPYP